MRTHIPLALGLVALLVAATACSSGSSAQPAKVRNYGPEAGATSSTVGAPGAGTSTWTPPTHASGPITWHTRLADAQAAANASGKMILVMSTKPRCGLCKKFQNEIAPATAGELSRVAVGYVYDITRPEVRDVDRLLRANLRGADLMPLVGFITPNLGWVHGFWGERSVQQFRGDIARATSIHPVRTADAGAIRHPKELTFEQPRMVRNEYGEREWGVTSDIWPEGDPEPIDAITGAPAALPDRVPAPVAGAQPAPDTMLADAGSPTIPAEPAPLPEAPVAAVPALGDGEAGLPPIDAPAAPEPATEPAPAPAPAPQSDEAWGRQALERALRLIRSGEFDGARAALAQVRDRLPDTQLAREASKGGVALYNAKKIRFATTGAERDRYLSRARRDFGGSMWAPLFNS